MFLPDDENDEEPSDARLAELAAERLRAIETERHLTREVRRRIRGKEHRRAQAAVKAERAAKRAPETRRSSIREWAHVELPPPTRVGSHGRYEARRVRWRATDGTAPWWLRHAGWWWLHNVIVHPLLGVLPIAALVALHDWSSGRLSRSPPPPSPLPRIPSRWRWLVHNVGAHVAIGLWPCAATFRWHDETAKRMAVPGWV